MSQTPSVIADGVVVTFHYTLTDDGEVIDTSAEREPLSTLQGAGNIVEGLEKALAGRAAGDSFEISVPPEQGYGERVGDGPETIPLAAFPEDAELYPGMQFMVTDEDDEAIGLYVIGVEDDEVLVERDHPLAGNTLHFAISVVELRESTEEERAHGHPHGPGGHHH